MPWTRAAAPLPPGTPTTTTLVATSEAAQAVGLVVDAASTFEVIIPLPAPPYGVQVDPPIVALASCAATLTWPVTVTNTSGNPCGLFPTLDTFDLTVTNDAGDTAVVVPAGPEGLARFDPTDPRVPPEARILTRWAQGLPQEANAAMAIIQELYGVEHEAKRREILGTVAHAALRKVKSIPMYCALMRIAHHTIQVHGPKTLLGKAARYAWTNIRELSRFLRDPTLPLDNNRAENALRIIALGRKNFLFVHSKESGEALALLYSLTTSCARLDVSPLDYLSDVLDRIEDTKVADLRELLPDRWKPRKARGPSDRIA